MLFFLLLLFFNQLIFVNFLAYARSTFVLFFSIFSEVVKCIIEIVQYAIQVTRAASKKEFNLKIFFPYEMLEELKYGGKIFLQFYSCNLFDDRRRR